MMDRIRQRWSLTRGEGEETEIIKMQGQLHIAKQDIEMHVSTQTNITLPSSSAMLLLTIHTNAQPVSFTQTTQVHDQICKAAHN